MWALPPRKNSEFRQRGNRNGEGLSTEFKSGTDPVEYCHARLDPQDKRGKQRVDGDSEAGENIDEEHVVELAQVERKWKYVWKTCRKWTEESNTKYNIPKSEAMFIEKDNKIIRPPVIRIEGQVIPIQVM